MLLTGRSTSRTLSVSESCDRTIANRRGADGVARMTNANSDVDERPSGRWSAGHVCSALVLTVVGYLLSSGPVLALAFKLREWTGRDEFYLAIGIYLPLIVGGQRTVFGVYIEWWCRLLSAVGPG
jgi:hypothetical protein